MDEERDWRVTKAHEAVGYAARVLQTDSAGGVKDKDRAFEGGEEELVLEVAVGTGVNDVRHRLPAYVSMRQHFTSATLAYVSIRQHTPADITSDLRQHTSAYVTQTSTCGVITSRSTRSLSSTLAPPCGCPSAPPPSSAAARVSAAEVLGTSSSAYAQVLVGY